MKTKTDKKIIDIATRVTSDSYNPDRSSMEKDYELIKRAYAIVLSIALNNRSLRFRKGLPQQQIPTLARRILERAYLKLDQMICETDNLRTNGTPAGIRSYVLIDLEPRTVVIGGQAVFASFGVNSDSLRRCYQ